MTEVPDYLLQRSRDRRSALGLGGGDDGGGDAGDAAPAAGTASAATPATTGSAAPVGKAPVPVPTAAEPEILPVPANVQAAMNRKRIPVWAMPVLVILPVWAWVYALTLDPPAEEASGALAVGEETYGACASCHGGGGGGGVGPALNGGAVIATFPDLAEHVRWIELGSQGWQQEVGDTYGAEDTAVGASGNVMPAFAELEPEELLSVVIYERVEYGEQDEQELIDQGYIDEAGELLVTLDEEGNLTTLDGEPFEGGSGGEGENASG